MVGCRPGSMPNWLEAILRDKFFAPCAIHESAKKKEKNIFCLDCCVGFCPQCLPVHRPHRLIQVRRYVYHDVVRVDDIEKLIDCSSVQSYTTNGRKVIFLNERPQGRPFRGCYNACVTCCRVLQEPYLFCCLNCKVKNLLRSDGGLWKELRECEYLPLPSSCELLDDEGQLSPDSILETASSGSAAEGSGSGPSRKKQGQGGSVRWASEAMSRRKKCAPVRAPLH